VIRRIVLGNGSDNVDLPIRKSIRLNGYDYSQNGAYFITISAKTGTVYLVKSIMEK